MSRIWGKEPALSVCRWFGLTTAPSTSRSASRANSSTLATLSERARSPAILLDIASSATRTVRSSNASLFRGRLCDYSVAASDNLPVLQ